MKKERKLKRLEIIEKYNALSLQCFQVNQDFYMLRDNNEYIDYYMKENWIGSSKDLYEIILHDNKYHKFKLDKNIIEEFIKIKENYENFENMYKAHNQWFIENEKRVYKFLFDNVEGRVLDEQQRECIVKHEVNNLVVAGAGSGKTTTIVGKIKYLLKRYQYNPDELLILSFTKASAAEMKERIKKETGKDIDVKTFHKLGLDIISNVEDTKRSTTDIEIDEYISEKFNNLTKDPEFNDLVNKYFLSHLRPYKDSFEFKSLEDYVSYMNDNNIRTFKRERVKSYEEMEIANYLFINNVRYIYEAKYKFDTRTRDRRQYTPDFYLVDYDIYLEHFGMDRKGNVPPFFEGRDGLSAKETYNKDREWKIKTHKKYDTKLIQTFSYEKKERKLLENLQKKLEEAGVVLKPMSQAEIWEAIENEKKGEISSFVRLITTFITQMKSNDFTVGDVLDINKGIKDYHERERNKVFIEIITPLYNSYQKELEISGDIDFNDMINKATKYVLKGQFYKRYSYIIVDEYQDISRTRYRLIKGIKDYNKAKLFCVGDDWQSIYRFAGSLISLFTQFENLYGYTEKSYIETTYRFNSSLIKVSEKFILKNKAQISKQLKPFKDDKESSCTLLYGNNTEELRISLKEQLDKLPQNASVALLGRYNNEIDLVNYLDNSIIYKQSGRGKKPKVNYVMRKDLDIEFMTVHGSKGLQADYVFILNNTNNKLGFPSLIEDDPVLKLFNQESEAYPYGEERRLFYVALTRAKKHVFLMVENNYKSTFIRELEDDYGIKSPDKNIIYCPKCGRGQLITKDGPYSTFYGCSNFPICRYTQKANNQEALGTVRNQ